MAGLIVSVRNRREAEIAAGNGASLVDVKEPRRGSLGRAGDRTIRLVVQTVSGKLPGSAALGELSHTPDLPGCGGLAYVKWGLFGYRRKNWRGALLNSRDTLHERWPACRPVVAAYADWKRAHSPPPNAVSDFVTSQRFSVLLFDTWQKDGSNLRDWISA